ncbi:MAG: hypothetical protein IIZ94_04845 [Prevotella sp.]|nr:hypothetical protein [Prevotella sp.]
MEWYNRFVAYNANPKNKMVDDCVVRALSKATGKDWYEVYDELCGIGRKVCCMPNGKGAYERFLKENGFVKFGYGKIEAGMKRESIGEFGRKHPNGAYVCVLANHLTVVVDGVWYDLESWEKWGSARVYSYWKKV